MELSIKQIKKFKIFASDFSVGVLHDLFFIPLDWKIHYITCDTGFWMLNKTVILSVEAIKSIDVESGSIDLKLTKENLENIPRISPENIVTRKNEEELSNYFGWPRYWELKKKSGKNFKKENLDTGSNINDLSFTRDIVGQNIESGGELIGVVKDLIVDLVSWEILYLIIFNKQQGKKGMLTLIKPEQIKYYSKDKNDIEVFPKKKVINEAPYAENINEITSEFKTHIRDYYLKLKQYS